MLTGIGIGIFYLIIQSAVSAQLVLLIGNSTFHATQQKQNLDHMSLFISPDQVFQTLQNYARGMYAFIWMDGAQIDSKKCHFQLFQLNLHDSKAICNENFKHGQNSSFVFLDLPLNNHVKDLKKDIRIMISLLYSFHLAFLCGTIYISPIFKFLIL